MNKVHTLKTGQQTGVWQTLRTEAEKLAAQDAALAPLLQSVILQARDLPEALGHLLSEKLAAKHLPEGLLLQIFTEFFSAVPDFSDTLERDIASIMTHDPAARDTVCPFLFFKGFHALESYRLAHYLWSVDRQHLALYLQNRISDLFGVDIHPAARIGRGVMMDHATGIVIGETAFIEDDVWFWHSVTLGGRDMVPGDRHPKVRKGAVLGANSTILGNIEIGAGAKVAAGSVVVASVPAGATVAGTPAKILQ
jgi:serine O-acetyltransferase